MGYAPVIGVYDVLARWQGDRRLLVAREASGHEVVGVHPWQVALFADEAELWAEIEATPHSLLPVADCSPDNIVGVIKVRDVQAAWLAGKKVQIARHPKVRLACVAEVDSARLKELKALPLEEGVYAQGPFRYGLRRSEVDPGGWRWDHDPAGSFAPPWTFCSSPSRASRSRSRRTVMSDTPSSATRSGSRGRHSRSATGASSARSTMTSSFF